ncbi:MAG TPA: Coenzyme F420 hydrogenase/dehydrogenase, beta subunit C-terminal domain [Methanocella sp.]|uniref:Coenzyme F420 hydrogenase/dehydrogenase, beta subunit C-terminal domain n=1 Tax=Methanocella sp. TaxID=2052833 RepID=UPI002B83AACD|nr:Coenzyme F420 hydrogenase/dehydrogenase, beta subunit C-terminal domain [Methanocella sp.]HTY90567.1 Coenzyme F420 hydrogenase/dehydrogenase, beta subunit C-terminal domain [Methanocella sp.]
MVNVKDMFYASAGSEAVCAAGECGGAVTALLTHALESKAVDAVVAMTRGADLYDGVPTVFTDPKEVIKSAGSLHCAPVAIGKFVVQYMNGARDKKIALPVKPCDARAILVMAKRGKVNRDNLLMIGVNCGGTVQPIAGREMIEKYYGVNPDDVVKEEIDRGKFIIVLKNGEHKEIKIDDLEDQGSGRRKNCQRCDVKIPTQADLACGNWGVVGPMAGKATFVEVCSAKGAKLMDSAIGAKAIAVSAPDPKGLELRAKTEQSMLKLAAKHQKKQFAAAADPAFWAEQFKKCIKCQGCTLNCPATFDMKLQPQAYEGKGDIPPSMNYHMARMGMVGGDCCNCGMCEDGCPVEIPLSLIYHEAARRIGQEIK